MVKMVEVNGKTIDGNQGCFLIAEAGVNHNGDLSTAIQLIDAALAAHVDAVKFQTWVTEKIIVVDAPMAEYQRKNMGRDVTQFEMLKKLELSYQDFRTIKAYADEVGILFFSTPDEEDSADFLDEIGVPLFKIGSGEVTNLPFLEHVGKKHKPIILSTGGSTLIEVEQAVRVIEGTGNKDLMLLHCVSSYPAEPEDCNLKAMETLRTVFQCPVGFSDHTLGVEIPVAAVAMGASIIEKHFTLDKAFDGPDHKASLEPDELLTMVNYIRAVEKSMGSGRKGITTSELETISVARKSLVAREDIIKGSFLTEEMIVHRRPGTGISPTLRSHVIGRTAAVTIPAGALISFDMLV